MLDLDKAIIKRLENPKVKVEDKLYLIARCIEEKHQFVKQPNYWEDKFSSMNVEEKVFYKLWLWLSYVEWELLVAPIEEFDSIFGKEAKNDLLSYLANEERKSEEDLNQFYTLGGKAGEILLMWGLEKLKKS